MIQKFQRNFRFINLEKRIKINTQIPYKKFVERIKLLKEQTKKLLFKLSNQNKNIHIYGASTKGNTILQWYGIDNNLIKFAADRNKDKWEAKTISSNIQIISEEKSKN